MPLINVERKKLMIINLLGYAETQHERYSKYRMPEI